MPASTAPDHRLLWEMNKSNLNVPFCISCFGASCLAPLLPNICLHKSRKERILVRAIILCKTIALSLTNAWTDTIAGSGCTILTCVQPQPDAGTQQHCYTVVILNNYTCWTQRILLHLTLVRKCLLSIKCLAHYLCYCPLMLNA